MAVLIVALIAIEFLLFDHFGAHRVTRIYPRWNDQIQYLSECYTGYEYARAHGFAAGLWRALINPSAQGTLHDFAAVVLFKFTGPSRSAALALNMLALIAWQTALGIIVARTFRSKALGFAAAALPLALAGPWLNGPGSAYDFRLDHLAMCAIGVASALGLATNGFRGRGASIVFGVACGIALLTRFLTGTYFLVAFAAIAAWVALGEQRGRRLGKVTLAAGTAAILAAPIFWLNREWVWNYYVIGHYVGPESAIRNQNFGIIHSLAFVFGQLATRHLGVFFGILATAGTVALACVRRKPRHEDGAPVPEKCHLIRDTFVLGAVFLLAPALVLTLHPQKSEVVLGALAPGVVLLVVAIWGWAGDCVGARAPSSAARFGVGFAAVAASLTYFGDRQLNRFETQETVAELRQVDSVADQIFAYSQSRPAERPRIAVDYITDALDAQVLRVVCYERHHVWIAFDMTLPTGIAEPGADDVRQRITASDFVFLTEAGPDGGFPFDRKLATLRPELRDWCDRHLRAVRRFTLLGRRVVMYERVPAAAQAPSPRQL